MPGGCPTRKREQKLQPGLLEPCALKGARTVLRGRGSGDTSSLPDNLRHSFAVGLGPLWFRPRGLNLFGKPV